MASLAAWLDPHSKSQSQNREGDARRLTLAPPRLPRLSTNTPSGQAGLRLRDLPSILPAEHHLKKLQELVAGLDEGGVEAVLDDDVS